MVLRLSKKPTEEMPFRICYLCRDEEDLASLSAGFDLVLELDASLYLPEIAAEGLEMPPEYAQSEYLCLPLQADKRGFLRYVSHVPTGAFVSKVGEYWRHKNSRWYQRYHSSRDKSSKDYPVYRGNPLIIIKGERKGSPCSLCPHMLDAMQSEPDCTFGIRRCLEELCLAKELVNEG